MTACLEANCRFRFSPARVATPEGGWNLGLAYQTEKERLRIQGSPTNALDGERVMLYGNFDYGRRRIPGDALPRDRPGCSAC